MDSASLGALMWLGLFWLAYAIKKRADRRRVSRNTSARQDGTGKWEQVAPMDECFDDNLGFEE